MRTPNRYESVTIEIEQYLNEEHTVHEKVMFTVCWAFVLAAIQTQEAIKASQQKPIMEDKYRGSIIPNIEALESINEIKVSDCNFEISEKDFKKLKQLMEDF